MLPPDDEPKSYREYGSPLSGRVWFALPSRFTQKFDRRIRKRQSVNQYEYHLPKARGAHDVSTEGIAPRRRCPNPRLMRRERSEKGWRLWCPEG